MTLNWALEESVRRYLVEKGVALHRLFFIGMGEEFSEEKTPARKLTPQPRRTWRHHEDKERPMTRRLWIGIALALAFTTLPLTLAPHAAESPSGTVRIESTSVAVGVGVTWGDGVLTYQGKDYKFSVGGLSVADVGISKLSVVGKVYNLKKVEDLSGNYVAGGVGIAVGGGAAAQSMKNQNGVTIELTATQTGVKFTFAAKGVDIKLKQ